MHIVDGALAPEVLIGGGVLAVAGLGLGLRKLPIDKIPATGVCCRRHSLLPRLFMCLSVHQVCI
jgi:ABC-type Co2+ transport system permease subunit